MLRTAFPRQIAVFRPYWDGLVGGGGRGQEGALVEKRFRVRSPRVMHETIEGEVILIALDTGTYYSLRESGADVWEAIGQGASEAEIVEVLSRRYEGSAEAMRSAVRELLGHLQEE